MYHGSFAHNCNVRFHSRTYRGIEPNNLLPDIGNLMNHSHMRHLEQAETYVAVLAVAVTLTAPSVRCFYCAARG